MRARSSGLAGLACRLLPPFPAFLYPVLLCCSAPLRSTPLRSAPLCTALLLAVKPHLRSALPMTYSSTLHPSSTQSWKSQGAQPNGRSLPCTIEVPQQACETLRRLVAAPSYAHQGGRVAAERGVVGCMADATKCSNHNFTTCRFRLSRNQIPCLDCAPPPFPSHPLPLAPNKPAPRPTLNSSRTPRAPPS